MKKTRCIHLRPGEHYWLVDIYDGRGGYKMSYSFCDKFVAEKAARALRESKELHRLVERGEWDTIDLKLKADSHRTWDLVSM